MSLIASERFRYPFSPTIRSSSLSSDLLKETPKRAILSLAMATLLVDETNVHSQMKASLWREEFKDRLQENLLARIHRSMPLASQKGNLACGQGFVDKINDRLEIGG